MRKLRIVFQLAMNEKTAAMANLRPFTVFENNNYALHLLICFLISIGMLTRPEGCTVASLYRRSCTS